MKQYLSSFKIFENNDYSIELIENVNVSTLDELLAVESSYIKSNECVNIVLPNQTKTEWYTANIVKLNQMSRIYRQNNKPLINIYNKSYRDKNKKHLAETRKIRLEAKVRPICVCGCSIRPGNMQRHILTSKHLKFTTTI
jgi:hypothetical protein